MTYVQRVREALYPLPEKNSFRNNIKKKKGRIKVVSHVHNSD